MEYAAAHVYTQQCVPFNTSTREALLIVKGPFFPCSWGALLTCADQGACTPPRGENRRQGTEGRSSSKPYWLPDRPVHEESHFFAATWQPLLVIEGTAAIQIDVNLSRLWSL